MFERAVRVVFDFSDAGVPQELLVVVYDFSESLKFVSYWICVGHDLRGQIRFSEN